MRPHLSRRADGELLREFDLVVLNNRHGTSEMPAYVGEVHARGLFRAEGYASMFKYCVLEQRMAEDVAWKRIQVARLARRFPVILDMIADGRLHVTSVVKLLPHQLASDFDELLEAATHKTKSELEQMLAARFPQPDAPTVVAPLRTSAGCQKLVPEPVVGTHDSRGSAPTSVERGGPTTSPSEPGIGGPVDLAQSERSESPPTNPAPVPVAPAARRARVQPLAPQRFAIQVTVGQATHDKLRRAQDLLGHRVPSGDLEQVLDRALDALIRQLEHAKFVSDSGRRCDERRDLEFDHLEPFARGGEATVSGVRLLCSAHNQLEAERIYGAGFMERKRGEARPDPAETRTARPSPALAPRRQPPQSPPTSAGARCT